MTSVKNDTIKIHIPSNSNNIRMVESLIDEAKNKFKITDDLYGNIMIAATESVANAIEHGNNKDENKNVLFEIEYKPNKLSITVCDEGKGYDYNNLPDPTLPENLLKTGGRGIFLMKQLSDKLTFDKNGSIVKMEFKITKN